MVFSVLTQKVLAILIGADGIAQVGNLRNIFSFFEQFSVLGTSNGLVKYISEYKGDKKQLNYLFSTAFVFTALSTLVSFIVLFFYANVLNDIVFGTDREYSYVFRILSFIIPFMGINAILNSLLNGLSAYKVSSKVIVVTVIFTAFLIVLLTITEGIKGSLLAISITPLIQFLSLLVFSYKQYKSYIDFSKLSFNINFKNRLLSYTFMTVIVVLFINVADVAIRNLIERHVDVLNAGYWTAMTSISKTYMQFSAIIFPLFILPQYAKINNTFDFRKEVKRIYKLLLPVLLISMTLVFLFRKVIVKVLYTDDFLIMSGLFKWQLMGDLVKFIALVIAYQFLAKRQIGYFVFTEILSVLLFYGFSVYFIEIYGTEGVVIAHFVRYIIYFFVVLYILRHNFIGNNRSL